MSVCKQSCNHPGNHQELNDYNCHGYCFLCGPLLFFNSNNNTNNTDNTNEKQEKCFSFAKPEYLKRKTEVDPVDIFTMISKPQPHIQPPPSEWYVKNRKKAIAFLRKIIAIYKFTDRTFYLALCYIDILMFNLKNLTNSRLELIVISSMLLASKFIENLNTEPNISRLIDLPSYYKEDDIIRYELSSLKKLGYKLNRIDPHELFLFLLSNGFIFSREIQHKPKEYINIIYCFAQKTLVDFLLSSASLSYDAVQISFSVIHLTRKHFGLKPQNFKVIRNIYFYHYSSYKECLNAIKLCREEGDMKVAMNTLNKDNNSKTNDNNDNDKAIKSVKSVTSRQSMATDTTKISMTLSKSFCSSKNKTIHHLLQTEEDNSSAAIRGKLNKSCKQLLTKTTLNQLIKLIAY